MRKLSSGSSSAPSTLKPVVAEIHSLGEGAHEMAGPAKTAYSSVSKKV